MIQVSECIANCLATYAQWRLRSFSLCHHLQSVVIQSHKRENEDNESTGCSYGHHHLDREGMLSAHIQAIRWTEEARPGLWTQFRWTANRRRGCLLRVDGVRALSLKLQALVRERQEDPMHSARLAQRLIVSDICHCSNRSCDPRSHHVRL